MACHLTEGWNRIGSEIWDNPTQAEADHIEMMLNEWAIHGDIEPGIYYWGREYRIEVAAE